MSDLRQRWIEALRSGEYKQGHGRLREGNRFCCLGVLSEVGGFEYDPRDAFPPGEATDEVGLTTPHMEDLAHRNDGYGNYDEHTFDEIADVIESWE